MKGKMKKLIAGIATLAMAAQFAVVIPASAENIVQTDIMAAQTFDSYTAPANTEVIADPADANNKVLKISNNATVDFTNCVNSEGITYLTYDLYFPEGVAITSGANPDIDGLYFTFETSAGGSVIKVYGESAASAATVPIGFSYGKSNGQYAKSGDLNKGTWYTVKVALNKLDNNIAYEVYTKASYGTAGATAVTSKTGIGFRNNKVPNMFRIKMGTGTYDKVTKAYPDNGEYFYIDNVRSYYEEDMDAANELHSISWKSTPGNVLVPPENAADGSKQSTSFPVSLTLTGTKGDLTEDECDITWSHIGTEKDDGYIGWDFTDGKASGNIVLTSGVSTYFVQLTATVKQKGSEDDPKVINYSFMINSSTSADANQIYPASGYPVDMDEYPDTLVDYTTGSGSADAILANWYLVGSGGPRLSLKKGEDGKKYFELTRVNSSGSAEAAVGLSLPASQVIFDFETKLTSGESFSLANYTSNNMSDNAGKYRSAFNISTDGSNITARYVKSNKGSNTATDAEGSISGLTAGEWYRIVASYDGSIKQFYIQAYDMEGTKKGEIPLQATQSDAGTSIFNMSGLPSNIRNLKVYTPTISKVALTSDKETVKVPETGDSDSTVELEAAVTTSEGLQGTGDVTFELEDDYAGVELKHTEGTQTAQLVVKEGASAGEINVLASKGGAQAVLPISLTSSSDNVAFTQSTSNITIPFTGEDNVVAKFTAETRDKDGKPVERESNITYALYNSTGTTEIENGTMRGVTFDKATGTLTVEPGAAAGIVSVKATNSDEPPLSNKVRVNIHGMSFSFGSGEPDEGYTAVDSSTVYSDRLGYGFAASTGLTDSASGTTGSANFTVKVKVPNGNYRVNIKGTLPDKGTVKSEAVSGSATGTTKASVDTAEALDITADIAVCDGVLDLTFSAGASISKLEISQAAAKTAGDKPKVYSIGDSTTKNAGHYSGYDAATATDHREYASWGNCVTESMYSENFGGYSNHGMAGRNSANYYDQARLEAVLLAVAPGDYVTINMGINSQASEPYEELMENYYVQGVLQRGAIPVILTHTPDGVDGSHGKFENGAFSVSRANDGRVKFLKSLATKYDLNLIDVGQWGEDYFNSLLTKDFATEVLPLANTVNVTKGTAQAPTDVEGVVKTWFPDHNHYTVELGSKIAAYIFDELSKIESNKTPDDPTPEAAKLKLPAAMDGYTVKLNGTAAADNAELKANDVITVEATGTDKVITAVNASVTFVVNDGVASYTVKSTDTADITITSATVADKPSSDFAIAFTAAPTISGAAVTITAEVTGTGTKTYDAYIAEYDGTSLKAVKAKTITISDASTSDTLSFDEAPTGTVKAFVWDQATHAPVLTQTTVSAAN